jgi:hypothetical protein
MASRIRDDCARELTVALLAGEFTMEYKMHAPVLPNIQKDMVEAYRKKQLSK